MLDNQQSNQIFQKINYPSITDEVIDQILNAIRENVFSPGEKLPSEPALADQLGVSRNTLREALNSLSEQGFIYRQRGVGTFITPQSEVMLNTNLTNMVGTSSMISSQKKSPGQKSFSFNFELPSKLVAENLKISQTTEVMHVSRVRTADGIPVINSDEYYPANIPGLDYDLSPYAKLDNWSIYDYFLTSNFEFNSALTNIHAVSADYELAQKLKIDIGTPLICLEQTHFCNSYSKPLLFCVNYHNDKMMNILLVRSM